MPKTSTENALTRFYKRALEKAAHIPRRNGKPEEQVNSALATWFHHNDFSMSRIESKAKYSEAAGRYMGNETSAGTSDWIGCDRHGTGTFVEAKAKGKRHTLKSHQRTFLVERILRGAFAACVDDVTDLDLIYAKFTSMRHGFERMDLLLKHLPKSKPKAEKIDSELGF